MSDIDTSGAIIGLSQLTQSKCYCPQCSVLEKLNHPMKFGMRISWVKNPNFTEADKKRKADVPSLTFQYLRIMLAYALLEGIILEIMPA